MHLLREELPVGMPGYKVTWSSYSGEPGENADAMLIIKPKVEHSVVAEVARFLLSFPQFTRVDLASNDDSTVLTIVMHRVAGPIDTDVVFRPLYLEELHQLALSLINGAAE